MHGLGSFPVAVIECGSRRGLRGKSERVVHHGGGSQGSGSMKPLALSAVRAESSECVR